MLSFDTNKDFRDNYKFLIGAILPRPIAVVSTLNEDGSNNLAPFSFFTAISASPMIVAFCPLIRSSTGQEKDTPRNIKRTGEFVINIVSEEIADKVNACSAELSYGEDEFLHSGLTPIDSMLVGAKRIKESKVHYECKFRDHISYGEHAGAGQIITGEVIKVHVDEAIYDNGRLITQSLNPIGRGAGNDWILCDHTIEMKRLMKAQIQK